MTHEPRKLHARGPDAFYLPAREDRGQVGEARRHDLPRIERIENDPLVNDLFQDGPPYKNGHMVFDAMVTRGFGGDASRATFPGSLGLVYSDMDSGDDRGGLERRHPVLWGMTIVGVVVTLVLMWWF